MREMLTFVLTNERDLHRGTAVEAGRSAASLARAEGQAAIRTGVPGAAKEHKCCLFFFNSHILSIFSPHSSFFSVFLLHIFSPLMPSLSCFVLLSILMLYLLSFLFFRLFLSL
jgi:hypothetical protein